MKTSPVQFFAVFFGPGYEPVQTSPNLQIYYIKSINYIIWSYYYIIILLIIKALQLAFQVREGLHHIETQEGGVVVDGKVLQLAFWAREGWSVIRKIAMSFFLLISPFFVLLTIIRQKKTVRWAISFFFMTYCTFNSFDTLYSSLRIP